MTDATVSTSGYGRAFGEFLGAMVATSLIASWLGILDMPPGLSAGQRVSMEFIVGATILIGPALVTYPVSFIVRALWRPRPSILATHRYALLIAGMGAALMIAGGLFIDRDGILPT